MDVLTVQASTTFSFTYEEETSTENGISDREESSYTEGTSEEDRSVEMEEFPKTGDETNLLSWLGVLVISGTIFAVHRLKLNKEIKF